MDFRIAKSVSLYTKTKTQINLFFTIMLSSAPRLNMHPPRVVAPSHITVDREEQRRPLHHEIRPGNNEGPAQQQQMAVDSDTESDYLGPATIAVLPEAHDQTTRDAAQTAPPTPSITPILTPTTSIPSLPRTQNTQTDPATPPQPNARVATHSLAPSISTESNPAAIHSKIFSNFGAVDYLAEIQPLYSNRFGIPGYAPPTIAEQGSVRGFLILPRILPAERLRTGHRT